MKQRKIKFRLRIGNTIVGYEQWFGGEYHKSFRGSVKGIWLYSKNGIHNWSDKFIQHSEKDQYTGLKDKRGVETYEGDIIKCNVSGNREVYFEDASYFTRNIYKGKKSIHFLTNDPKYYEVIGNIYSNPEF